MAKVNRPNNCYAQRRQPQTPEHTGCSMVKLIRAEAKQTAEVELSGPEALGAPPLHGFQSVGCACLAQHPAEMVLHGLFGEIQPCRDLLVGETFADQLNELLLSASQAQVLSNLHAGLPRPGSSDMIEERAAKDGWANGFALGDGPNRTRDLRRRGVLQDVASHAMVHCNQELFRITVHSKHQNFHIREVAPEVE